MDFVLSFRYHVFNAREWPVLACVEGTKKICCV